MTITIRLGPEEERKLAERAAQAGKDLAGYVLRLIERDIEAPPRDVSTPDAKRTFAEILAPIHEDFRESGMSGDELDALLEDSLSEVRSERREKKSHAS